MNDLLEGMYSRRSSLYNRVLERIVFKAVDMKSAQLTPSPYRLSAIYVMSRDGERGRLASENPLDIFIWEDGNNFPGQAIRARKRRVAIWLRMLRFKETDGISNHGDKTPLGAS